MLERERAKRGSEGNSHMLPQTLQAVISVEVSSIFHKIGKVFRQASIGKQVHLEALRRRYLYICSYDENWIFKGLIGSDFLFHSLTFMVKNVWRKEWYTIKSIFYWRCQQQQWNYEIWSYFSCFFLWIHVCVVK